MAYAEEEVALLAEGVDRNSSVSTHRVLISKSPSSRRAWIEIAVKIAKNPGKMSPSSRRAWIEIGDIGRCQDTPTVALLAEGVDRNAFLLND